MIWDTLPLGRLPDAAVAARAGVSEAEVVAVRTRRGIPAPVPQPPSRPADLTEWPADDAQAARALGIPEADARQIRRARGHLQRKPFTEADLEYLRTTYPDKGLPVGTIAAHLGRSPATVYVTAQKLGLTRR